MGQTVSYNQISEHIIDDIGATTLTVPALTAAYPDAKNGNLVVSDSHLYLKYGGTWRIYSKAQNNVAFKHLPNGYSVTQDIPGGGIKTAAPTGAQRSDVRLGAVAVSVDALEIDPYKFIPWMDNGQLFKVPVLRIAAAAPSEPAPTAQEHPLRYGASQGPACSAMSSTTYYSSEQNLLVGTVLYTNTEMTTPLSTAGYYSDGSAWYQIDANGEIVATGSCSEYLVNTFDFDITYYAETDPSDSPIVLDVTSDFPPTHSNPGLGEGYNTIPVEGVSGQNMFELTFSFNQSRNVTTVITITDGTNDYAGMVSGNGTSLITITFNIGMAIDRTFALKGGQNNLIHFTRPL